MGHFVEIKQSLKNKYHQRQQLSNTLSSVSRHVVVVAVFEFYNSCLLGETFRRGGLLTETSWGTSNLTSGSSVVWCRVSEMYQFIFMV